MKQLTFLPRYINQCLIGIAIMFNLFSSAHPAPQFKLKPIDYYFTDSKAQGLLQAALEGNQPAAQQWLNQGANPNEEGPMSNQYNRIGLLHYAIAADNPNAAKILVALGADPELVTKGGSALGFAIYLEKPALLAALLDVRPFQTLNLKRAQIILFSAANSPVTDCLELLLQRGFPIDLKDTLGRTALIDVLSSFDFDRAEWLINHGANVLVEDRGGVTPAYDVQDALARVKPGTESEQKLLNLKNLMQAKGAVFPVLSPQEVRAQRASGH